MIVQHYGNDVPTGPLPVITAEKVPAEVPDPRVVPDGPPTGPSAAVAPAASDAAPVSAALAEPERNRLPAALIALIAVLVVLGIVAAAVLPGLLL